MKIIGKEIAIKKDRGNNIVAKEIVRKKHRYINDRQEIRSS